MRRVAPVGLAAVSGGLLCASDYPLALWPLQLVALVPALAALRLVLGGVAARRAARRAVAAGAVPPGLKAGERVGQ
jgi:hypothetical protein